MPDLIYFLNNGQFENHTFKIDNINILNDEFYHGFYDS